MFKPKGPFCQSCGMPLSKDKQGGGTEKNGTLSKEYCSHCYQNGSFVHPDLNVHQMIEFVTAKLGEMYIPKFLAGYFTKDIPSLNRWKNEQAQLDVMDEEVGGQ